jgi:hypothetical protein
MQRQYAFSFDISAQLRNWKTREMFGAATIRTREDAPIAAASESTSQFYIGTAASQQLTQSVMGGPDPGGFTAAHIAQQVCSSKTETK